jgi:hypothetical protein
VAFPRTVLSPPVDETPKGTLYNLGGADLLAPDGLELGRKRPRSRISLSNDDHDHDTPSEPLMMSVVTKRQVSFLPLLRAVRGGT